MDYRKTNIRERKGIYIILDLNTFTVTDLPKLDELLSPRVLAVQIWDNQDNYLPLYEMIKQIVAIVQQHQIPILMNNSVDLASKFNFNGVHFDEIPADWDVLKEQLAGKLVGITCTNNIALLQWAEENQIDYVSFCSMYPSANNTRCELVDKKIITQFQNISRIPFFLAGGITPENLKELSFLSYTGIALVSGLMTLDNPKEFLDNFYNKIN